jgi:MinD-like ATPase involved in chromosome partitioning or flagellar assembly
MNNRPDEDQSAADPPWLSSEAVPAQQFTSHRNGENFDAGEGPQDPPRLSTASPDEFDEIEGRAARLMAQMEAQRLQRQAPQSEQVDDLSWGTDRESADIEDEYELTTVEPPTEHVAAPTDISDDISNPEPPSPQQPPGPEDVAPEELERPTSARHMALPPWQRFPPPVQAEFDATPDAAARSTGTRAPAGQHDEPAAAPGGPPSDTSPPAPQTWRPGGPPLPQPDWQGPLPGWPPELPPPPPGWQGLPPWMWATEQSPPHQLGPDNSPPATREPTQPRHLRNDAGPQRAESPLHSTSRTDYRTRQVFAKPSLDEAETVIRDRQVPESGWQRIVYQLTGGLVKPGISRKDRERRALLEQIRQPILGDFRIAVLSLKGGVGKTTTTLGLGSALATVRTDRVIAIDANPDRGTLAERIPDSSTTSTVRDLLRDPNIKRYADVRNHTRMATSRLEVLASEQDPEVAEVFGETDYRHAMDILRHYYNIILTDCGTGIMHSAMAGVLDVANAIVLVTSPAIDAARSASATLDWLMQHGHGALVREAHVVLTAPKPGSAALKLDKVVEYFEARCRSTHVIPFEPHLAGGADFDFGLLKPVTARAYLELAGAVSERFSRLAWPYDVR